MKVQCGQCPAKYAVADERIRDKKVRIHCRRCNASIVVDGKVNPPLVTSTPARPSIRPLSSIPAPESSPPPSSPDPESQPSPRPVAHTIMGGLEAPVARQLVTEHVAQQRQAPATAHGAAARGWTELRPGMPEPDRGFTEPPEHGDAERWRVALTQQDLRWMTTAEIAQAFRDGAVKSETFVFRAGMPTWVTLLEVTEIAQALADAGLVSSPLRAPLALALAEEEDEKPPSKRLSSLPPPRKALRQRGAGESTSSDPRDDGTSDSEESLPFALVQERASSSRKPEAQTDEASEQPIAMLDASLKELAARELETRAAAAEVQASPHEPTLPLPSAPQLSAPIAVVLQPTPLQPAAPASPEQTARSEQTSGGAARWIWIVVALLLLVGAAVFLLGPRLGWKLP